MIFFKKSFIKYICKETQVNIRNKTLASNLQFKVCHQISVMKGTWADIANNGTFDTKLEAELDKENESFITLETEVNDKLTLYLQAHEFLSWTIATMNI